MKILKKIKDKIVSRATEELVRKYETTNCKYDVNVVETKLLENKVAIVTGGSGAIGSAISFKLAMMGAKVYICGRNIKKLNLVCEQIKNNGGISFPIILDVTDENNINEVFSSIYKKEKKRDFLINNAGGSTRENNKPLVDQSMKLIKDIMMVNFEGSLLCSKYAAKYMIKKNYGKIINIASTVGVSGLENFLEYGASKAAVINYTKTLAMELGKYNINVNCVSPGKINQIIFDKPIEKRKTTKNYICRIGTTDDIANVVSFLASDSASYITGQNIIVDGGRTLGLKGE